jgi:outer membrane lipoprotein SlyB
MRTPARLATVLAVPLLLSACVSPQPQVARYPQYQPPRDAYAETSRYCDTCGTVERIEPRYNARPNTGSGAVLGGIVGAIVGHELADGGSRDGRIAATAAGAAAGAVAGNAIENKANRESFDVTLRMDDGRRLTLNLTRLPAGVREGSYVRYAGRQLTLLR